MRSMSKKILVVFLLLMVSFSVESHRKQLHHFKLWLVWPNSFCNTNYSACKKPIPQEFKVGHLLPFTANHLPTQLSHPNHSFTEAELRQWSFSRSLSSVWPNLLHGENDIDLWEWEWRLHGRESGMSPQLYFLLAVKYAIEYQDLYDLLVKSGVTPSDDAYQQYVLQHELVQIVGAIPNLRCTKYRSVDQLTNICICIDLHGVPFNCPKSFSNCGKQKASILFPTEKTVLMSRKHG